MHWNGHANAECLLQTEPTFQPPFERVHDHHQIIKLMNLLPAPTFKLEGE